MKKKEYKKPEVVQVRLALRTPILANCNEVNELLAADPVNCNSVGASCAPVTS